MKIFRAQKLSAMNSADKKLFLEKNKRKKNLWVNKKSEKGNKIRFTKTLEIAKDNEGDSACIATEGKIGCCSQGKE